MEAKNELIVRRSLHDFGIHETSTHSLYVQANIIIPEENVTKNLMQKVFQNHGLTGSSHICFQSGL